MRILMVNKFLHPNGGSETYIFKLGEYLRKQGHEVEYFGMEHENRCVGNRLNLYTSDMDFHGGSYLGKLSYPVKTIYSREAAEKIRMVLEDFQPDAVHLNNFNYQLTPSIILEICRWRRAERKPCRIVFTAHDYQLLCPNHQMRDLKTGTNCEKCLDGSFYHCMQNRCIHGSLAKSAVGMMEAYFWNWQNVYRHIDTIICCSQFMKRQMDRNLVFAGKTIAIHNFIDIDREIEYTKNPYVLYFGRFSQEKGIHTLLSVCRELPEIPFVFAGTGPLEAEVNGISNIRNVGFQTGEALRKLIGEARFSIYPSEWYENCPFSVMESQIAGTPVLGADIGGISELIEDGKTGLLFESGNREELKAKIRLLWENETLRNQYTDACGAVHFPTLDEYGQQILAIYQKKRRRR